MSRAEHLAWAKERALEYIGAGDPQQAITSLFSDLRKHDDLRDHGAIELGSMLLFGGHLSGVREAREFIEGCN